MPLSLDSLGNASWLCPLLRDGLLGLRHHRYPLCLLPESCGSALVCPAPFGHFAASDLWWLQSLTRRSCLLILCLRGWLPLVFCSVVRSLIPPIDCTTKMQLLLVLFTLLPTSHRNFLPRKTHAAASQHGTFHHRRHSPAMMWTDFCPATMWTDFCPATMWTDF